MREYARQRGLRRLMIPVPVLTPRLSSLWLGLVTPVYARVGRKLIDSAAQRDRRARPARARASSRSGRAACARRSRGRSRTRTASSPRRAGRTRCPPRRPAACGGVRLGSRLVDSRARRGAVPAGRGVRADPAHRRRDRLVLRRRPLAPARPARPARRRRRHAPRPARPRGARVGRRARLLAGRGVRAGPPAAAARRDEAARPRLAAVRGRARRRRRVDLARRRSSTRPGSRAGRTGTRLFPSTA